MQQQFHHILDITLLHGYFKSHNFKTIQFALADSAKALSRNLGIVLKPFTGGISMFSSMPELLKASDFEMEPIRLNVYCYDSFYVNYTELTGYYPMQTILYFSNLNHDNYLHYGAFVGPENVILLSSGIIKIPNYKEASRYQFINAVGTPISEVHIQKTQTPGEYRLTNFKEGLIKIFQDYKKVATVYVNTKTIWNKPLAIIDIYPSKLDDFNTNQVKQEYLIAFNNRRTIWKYFLVDSVYEKDKFKNLKIRSQDKPNLFGSPMEVEIANKKVRVFESLEKIPLQEFADNHFELVNSVTGELIVNRLPQASPDQLFNSDGESMYSHIYI